MPNQSLSREISISEEIKVFIDLFLPSVTHLNVLLLLYQSPHQEFGIKMIIENLHLSHESVENALSDLAGNSLLVKNEKSRSYCYSQNGESNKLIGNLKELFIINRKEIIHLILRKTC